MKKKIKMGITGSKLYNNKLKIKEFIFGLKNYPDKEFTIVGLGDSQGADQHIKKYALEFGYAYREHNLPHSVMNLYSAMSPSFYDRPYTNRNRFVRDKIFAKDIEACVIFNDSPSLDLKCSNIIRELNKLNHKIVVIQ